jgi:homoserine dehydrogenase
MRSVKGFTDNRMAAVGFLDLPSWHGVLREQLKQYGQDRLLGAPVLCGEAFSPPWRSMEAEEFGAVQAIGLSFAEGRSAPELVPIVITADGQTALSRLFADSPKPTGARGALGGLYPLLGLCGAKAFQPDIQRLLGVPDGVLSFVAADMERTGATVDEAFREAQWQGVAPGHVTRHAHGLVLRDRLALLASLLLGIRLHPDDVPTEGIQKVAPRDVAIAREHGFCVRVLGSVEQLEKGIAAWVGPCVIPERYLLARLRGGTEAMYVQFVDKTSLAYIGQGSEKENCLRGMLLDLEQAERAGALDYPPLRPVSLVPSTAHQSCFYLRFSLLETTATLAKITTIFAESGVDIERLLHVKSPGAKKDPDQDEMVLFTKKCSESTLTSALDRIATDAKLASLKARMRLEL